MSDDDFPHKMTEAAKALSQAIERKGEYGISLRTLAGKLNYKSAVVLSHMRLGRLPIPVERAVEIAGVVGLDPVAFLMQVLEQRYPEVDFSRSIEQSRAHGRQLDKSPALNRLLSDLEIIAGRGLDALSAEHIEVMRALVAEPSPRRRWVSPFEAAIVELVRKTRPDLVDGTLDRGQQKALVAALKTVPQAPA